MLNLPSNQYDTNYWSERQKLLDWTIKCMEADIDGEAGGANSDSRMSYLTYPCLLIRQMSEVLGRKPKVLDLGSGLGIACLTFAREGCEVVGIEINDEKHLISKENLIKSKSLGVISHEAEVTLIHGNFFPNNFTPRRGLPEDVFCRYLLEKSPTRFQEGSMIHIRTADLFYHYQVETVENLLNFFVKYAKPGALLFIIQHGITPGFEKIPQGIRYLNPLGETLPGEGHLYQKVI